MKTMTILEEQYIAMSQKCSKYDALADKVEKLNDELDEAGDAFGLEQFGELVLTEFGYL